MNVMKIMNEKTLESIKTVNLTASVTELTKEKYLKVDSTDFTQFVINWEQSEILLCTK